MSALSLTIRQEIFPVAGNFTISRGSRTEIQVVSVQLSDGVHVGNGECVPYARYNETVESVSNLILELEEELKAGAIDRKKLQERLPAGAARNALDCAFWDLEAKQAGKPVWQLANLENPVPLSTAYTISLASPEKMGVQSAENAFRPLLKVKLGTPDDLARIKAVRENAPNSTIIADANEGWSRQEYLELAPQLSELGVAMVEQPLPADQDDELLTMERLLPVCADESCHARKSLDSLKGKYDIINIKLDKTGGLTEALALKQAAIDAGFGIMVGCMLGSSLSMAPAFLVAQGVDFVDLDAPLLLAGDRDDAIQYDASTMMEPDPKLWG